MVMRLIVVFSTFFGVSFEIFPFPQEILVSQDFQVPDGGSQNLTFRFSTWFLPGFYLPVTLKERRTRRNSFGWGQFSTEPARK